MGNSLLKIFLFTSKGLKRAHNPKTKPMFAILLPMIFPKAIAGSFLIAAIIPTPASGALVPKATITAPTNKGVNLKRKENFTAP